MPHGKARQLRRAVLAERSNMRARPRLALANEPRQLRDEFVELVLGMSPKDARLTLTLHWRLASLPLTLGAWRRGDISEGDAWTLSRIAERSTEHAWLEHAARCARPRLVEEVERMIAIRDVLPHDEYLALTKGLPLSEPRPTSELKADLRVRARRAANHPCA
jgi:hypothetical protein